MIEAGARREFGPQELFRRVRDESDARHAFGAGGLCDPLYRHRAVDGLAARHGDGVVIEDLVGDVRTCGDGLTDRQRARMIPCAFAEVLKHVPPAVEHRACDPGHPLAAHLRETGGFAVHPAGHHVTADA